MHAVALPLTAPQKNGATSITVTDSVEVVETNSVFVARPNLIAVDGFGRSTLASK